MVFIINKVGLLTLTGQAAGEAGIWQIIGLHGITPISPSQ